MAGTTLIIHPHLHRRRTGVTTHVEAMIRAQRGAAETWGFGVALDPELPRLTLPALLARLARLGREEAVWHAHRNLELLLGLALRLRFPRLRVIFTRHAARVPGRWTRFLARRADRCVALTPAGKEGWEVPAEVVPHGVDLTRFHPPRDRAAAWRALGQGGLHGVGVIGRIRPDKGQEDFARAWAQARHPDWRAVLVGDARGRHRRFLRRVLAQGGEGLAHVGEQTSALPWYEGLSVVVLPSHAEGFSLVLLEALAAGCCVVAAQLPHFPAWVEHGRTGFLYPPGDANALAAQLFYLFERSSLVAEVGARAADEARARFGVESEARSLAAVYEGVVRK